MIANRIKTEALTEVVRLQAKELNRLTWERDRARKERTEARKSEKELRKLAIRLRTVISLYHYSYGNYCYDPY